MQRDEEHHPMLVWDRRQSMTAAHLLLKAELILQSQLDEAIQLCATKHFHVLQALIVLGSVTPGYVHAAVDAVQMVREHQVDIGMAESCLKIACNTGQTFADVVLDQKRRREEDSNSAE